ncbi:flagellar basal body rod protein FlgC [Mariprofundus sp. EBB-1]|uniref:flagellar basal body rod protein FlgC n=1 Tax=Mariprofundus sp. EBB-1 TaxID=2650971 RepID=UPI000EF265AA|nr:flagellar basal body rod protein FlgC [Mariprofundus sp. EBB-1]RLL53026.1 flagellar basal body rod protein FlgC [Mariprofundus sp. EBB-1]
MANDLLSSMHISAAGMTAQRTRMDIVSENIANAESTRTENGGGPYKRRQVVFQAVTPQQTFSHVFNSAFQPDKHQSVKAAYIAEDNKPFREVYDPSHPDADSNGIVKMPNVNPVQEMVDMNGAARSFEANVTTMEASKRMFLKSLELLR